MSQDFRANPCYYASAQDAGRTALLLGPFETEAECRKWAYGRPVDGGSSKHWNLVGAAERHDPRSWFYTYGMVKMQDGSRIGVLNKYFVGEIAA